MIDKSMRGKLMTRPRRIRRIFCMRCGLYQGNWSISCECLPLWLCMDDYRAELCREQQCLYCNDNVINEWRPRRYPRIFNVRKPTCKSSTVSTMGFQIREELRKPTRTIQLPGYTIMEDDVYGPRT